MNLKALIGLAFFVSILLSACDKDDIEGNDDKNEQVSGELTQLLPLPIQEAIGVFSASMDGHYFGTEYDDKYYFTTDGGKNWKTVAGSSQQTGGIKTNINKNGYKIWKFDLSKAKATLYNLQTGSELNVQYPKSSIYAYNSNGFFLGDDDYVYVIDGKEYYYQKFGDSDWDALPIDVSNSYNNARYMAYAGVNIETGGAVFIDDENQKLLIHHPGDNSVDIKDVSYDLARIYKRLAGGDPPTRYAYNGNDRLVAGNNQGLAIVNVTDGSVVYHDWEAEYKKYDNPINLSIDENGVVFATVAFTVMPDGVKGHAHLEIENNQANPFFAVSNVVSRGAYSYYFTRTDLRRSSKSGIEYMNTPRVTESRADKIKIVSAREVNGQKYIVMVNPNAFVHMTSLFRYDDTHKRYEEVPGSLGNYNYIYAEGNKIYVYGTNVTFYSNDGGQSWERELREGRPRGFQYITRSGNQYYATARTAYKYDPADMDGVVMKSTDLLNWTDIGGKSEVIVKDLLRVITPSGFGVSKFFSNGMEWFFETRDYGKTWTLLPEDYAFFNAENKGSVYHIYGASNKSTLSIKRYDEHYKLLEEKEVPNNGHQIADPDQIYFNASGDMYLVAYDGFYMVKK